MRRLAPEQAYFAQVKWIGAFLDRRLSGEMTFSCSQASTVLPGCLPFMRNRVNTESEDRQWRSGQVRPPESCQV
jgi:hypothetical protein